MGLIKSNPSYNYNEYYKDSICLYSNGYYNKLFEGKAIYLLKFTTKSDDIILL